MFSRACYSKRMRVLHIPTNWYCMRSEETFIIFHSPFYGQGLLVQIKRHLHSVSEPSWTDGSEDGRPILDKQTGVP